MSDKHKCAPVGKLGINTEGQHAMRQTMKKTALADTDGPMFHAPTGRRHETKQKPSAKRSPSLDAGRLGAMIIDARNSECREQDLLSLSLGVSLGVSLALFVCPSVCLSTCLPAFLSDHLSDHLSVCLSVCQSPHLSSLLSVSVSVCLSASIHVLDLRLSHQPQGGAACPCVSCRANPSPSPLRSVSTKWPAVSDEPMQQPQQAVGDNEGNGVADNRKNTWQNICRCLLSFSP